MAGSSPSPLLTLAFATHRPETVALSGKIFAEHEVILLEEPPHPQFSAMLAGRVDSGEYLLDSDFEYPEFGLAQCRQLQQLHLAGKTILQIEPFLEQLLLVQQFFADGHAPAELDPDSPRYPVYQCEKDATGTLLTFYQEARGGNFSAILQALLAFARADAKRFRLRDRLRAEQILATLHSGRNTAVEAGPIHLLLGRILRQRLPAGWLLRTRYVDNLALNQLAFRGTLFSPGDELTLAYLLQTRMSAALERLRAARALIYAKVVAKEELIPGDCPFPHTRQEYLTIRLVRRLSFTECQNLFFRTRPLPTAEAYAAVEDFLRRKAGPGSLDLPAGK